jgi:SM-20-related protein
VHAERLATELYADLFAHGIAVRDRFLEIGEVRALAAAARERRAGGEFSPARIGAGERLLHREDIRGDLTCWLGGGENAAERGLLRLLEELRLRLVCDGLPGLFDLELHYACYPPGAAYARHVDRPQGRDQREVSLILYLNENWQGADGGALRVYSQEEKFRDIEPIGGRLVLFLTEGREHAVLPARRERLSVAGWFRSRPR